MAGKTKKPTMREQVNRVLHLVSNASATGFITVDRLATILDQGEEEARFIAGKDTGATRARRILRLLEEQRLLENLNGQWREAALGAVWRILVEAEREGEDEVSYQDLITDARLDRYTAKAIMNGISSGHGKNIIEYQPRRRVVALGVYDPTIGD